MNITLTHDEIRRASTAKLKNILKNDDPDVYLHDMIDYELYSQHKQIDYQIVHQLM